MQKPKMATEAKRCIFVEYATMDVTLFFPTIHGSYLKKFVLFEASYKIEADANQPTRLGTSHDNRN